jgi:hypothetical protein
MQAPTPPGAAVDFSNLHTARQTFGAAARSVNPNERAAAATAMEHLDDYLRNIPAGDVIGGNAQQAANTLRTAIDNYSAASRADRIGRAAYRADNNAAVSGASTGQAMRQQFRSMLNSRNGTRGFSPDEVAQMQKAVRGTLATRAMNGLGTVMGGSHPILASAVAGHVLPPAMVVPLAGKALKVLAQRATMRQAAKLDAMVRSRSPLGLNGLRLPREAITPPALALRLATLGSGAQQ